MDEKNDLTIIYYTANTTREPFATNVREILWKAKGGSHLISVSQKPMDFGENIVVDLKPAHISVYKQILIGAKAAKTKFVALAEDDCLYSKEHFEFRPDPNEFAYDMARWSIYSWSRPPIYSIKYRIVNSMMIASRDLLVEALEERFKKFPDESKIPLRYFGEMGRHERRLGVTRRKMRQFASTVPSITFSHPQALGFQYTRRKKKIGILRTYDIPYWGRADNMINNIF